MIEINNPRLADILLKQVSYLISAEKQMTSNISFNIILQKTEKKIDIPKKELSLMLLIIIISF